MTSYQNDLWLDKAIGFVARARQEMWGKHNEEMMAFLFKIGISNKTAKDYFFGWNRRNKLRSAESWGLIKGEASSEAAKLFFPEGIVIPYIVEKQLKKITIVISEKGSADNDAVVIEGSQPVSMIFGETQTSAITYVVPDILDGFYFLQEWALKNQEDKICLILPHDLSNPPDDWARERLLNTKTITFLTENNETACRLWAKEFENSRVVIYQGREELIKKIDRL